MTLTDNLVSYYKFDSDSNDIIGTNNMSLTSITYTAGKINDGLSISTNTAYMTPTTDFNQTNITFSFWYYFDNNNTGYKTLIARNSGTYHHCIINESNEIGFFNVNFYGSGFILTPNNWYHIVIVKEGTNEKIYVNNDLKLDSADSFDNSTYNASIFLNYSTNGNQSPLGIFDELGVWDRALTTNEINELYNSGAGLSYPFVQTNFNLTDNLLSYYKLDEISGTIANDSLHNNDGSNTNVTYNDSGIINKSYNYNSNINSNTNLNSVYSHTNMKTVSLWYKSGSYTTYNYIMGRDDGTSNVDYQIMLRNSSIIVNIGGVQNPATNNTGIIVDDDAWHHVVVVIDNNVVKLYFDSVLQTQTGLVGTGTSGNYLMIGNRETFDGLNFNGNIDEVGIWDRVLTDSDISELYNNGIGLTYNNDTLNFKHVLTDELISYYSLNEKSGNDVIDSTNYNTGTNNNALINQTGILDRAYSFNGTDSYLDLNNPEKLSNLDYTKHMSFSVWIKTSSTNNMTILGREGDNINECQYRLELNNGAVDFAVGTTDSNLVGSGINDNNWHHIFAIYDGVVAKIYIDNIYEGDGAVGTNTYNTNVYVGKKNSSNYFDGLIDEIGIWSRAVKDYEVTKLYNYGYSLAYPFGKSTTLMDNLLSYYKFDDDAIDSISSNNMTLYSITYASGKINNGLSISTNAAYMLPTINFTNTNITFSFWYYYNGGSGYKTLIAHDGGIYHHCIIDTNGEIGFFNSGFYGSGFILTPNNWYHIVIVKEGTNEKIYVNSDLKLDSADSFDNTVHDAGIFLNYKSGGDQGPLGIFDELGIWNRALTSDEIVSLYNNGNGVALPFTNTTPKNSFYTIFSLGINF